jgi:HTH-type transcriptional regulator / antitoxin HigA
LKKIVIHHIELAFARGKIMDHEMLEAWKSFNALAPVPLGPISSEQDYDRMIEFMNELMDSYDGNHHSSEGALLHVMGSLIAEWEQAHPYFDLSRVTPVHMLAHYMEARSLTQKEVEQGTGIGQSILSLLLSGKREINAAHARALGAFFRVNPGVFL